MHYDHTWKYLRKCSFGYLYLYLSLSIGYLYYYCFSHFNGLNRFSPRIPFDISHTFQSLLLITRSIACVNKKLIKGRYHCLTAPHAPPSPPFPHSPPEGQGFVHNKAKLKRKPTKSYLPPLFRPLGPIYWLKTVAAQQWLMVIIKRGLFA